MYWLKLSTLSSYVLIAAIHLGTTILQYDLFLSDSLYVDFELDRVQNNQSSSLNLVKTKYFNEIQTTNTSWFVFSTFVSVILISISWGYYSYIYLKQFFSELCIKKNKEALQPIWVLNNEVFYIYEINDFAILGVNLGWSLLWLLHLSIESFLFLEQRRTQVDISQINLILALQIALIALRYPQLFFTQVIADTDTDTDADADADENNGDEIDDDDDDLDQAISAKIVTAALAAQPKPKIVYPKFRL